MARFDPNNPYLGRRGPSPLRGRTSIRLGGGRGIPSMPRLPGGKKPASAAPPPGSSQATLDALNAHTDRALNEGDEDNQTAFARGGTILRKQNPCWKGISRIRPNVDTSNASLRAGDRVQENL